MREVDVLIVGGGVAGLSCAMYTSKAGLKTLVLNSGKPQLESVAAIWNLPGITDPISGSDWLASARTQVSNLGGCIEDAKVDSISLEKRPYLVSSQEHTQWATKYLVFANNLGNELLERHGFPISINENVPSRKIRKVAGVGYDGKTAIAGVFVAGLLSDVPSQTVIAAGHGTFVGVQIASDHLNRAFMWHD